MPAYSPSELTALVDAKFEQAGGKAFVTSRNHNRSREMWCAARFATVYSAHHAPCMVDIEEVDEQREYDFHLLVGQARLPFQVTEVLDRDRRRGDEYKRVLQDEEFQQLASAPQAAQRIKDELEAKQKKYRSGSSSLHALLYVNVRIFGLSWTAVVSEAAAAASAFASVWLICDTSIGCLYGGNHWKQSNGWHSLPTDD